MNQFREDYTQQIFNGQSVRRVPTNIHRRARMRIQRILAAAVLDDLRAPPSHRLKLLRGNWEGQFSIPVNDRWRVCFIWTERGVKEIELVDYH